MWGLEIGSLYNTYSWLRTSQLKSSWIEGDRLIQPFGHTLKKPMWRQAEAEGVLPQNKEGQEPPEPGRAQEGLSPQNLWKERGSGDTLIMDSERTFWCFEPPSLWDFVPAALESKNNAVSRIKGNLHGTRWGNYKQDTSPQARINVSALLKTAICGKNWE